MFFTPRKALNSSFLIGMEHRDTVALKHFHEKIFLISMTILTWLDEGNDINVNNPKMNTVGINKLWTPI